MLLSARNTWTLYDVDLRSGLIRWRLGGPHSSFKLGAGVHFYWQHDAEFQPGGLISVFDNGSDPAQGEAVARPAAGVSEPPRTRVRLVKAFTNPSQNAARLQPGQHPQPARRATG